MGRMLKVKLYTVEPLSSESSVYCSVIHCSNHIHYFSHSVRSRTLSKHQFLLCLTHTQYSCLRRINNGRYCINSKHSKIADCSCSTHVLVRVKFTFFCSFSNVFGPSSNVKKSKSFSSKHNRSNEPSFNGNCNAYI